MAITAGKAASEFRPTVWAKSFIANMEKALVYKNVVNTSYQGDIAGGARSVKINEIGKINIGTYTEMTAVTTQLLTSAQKELVIDQQKYFSFSIDDVLKAQSNVGLMEKAMQQAAFNMADDVDEFIGELHDDSGIAGSATTSGNSTAALSIYATSPGLDNVLSVFSHAQRYMDEADVPTLGRWCVMPPWLHQYLKIAQIIDFQTAWGVKGGDTTKWGNGYIGKALGFDVYASNNVDYSSALVGARVMFGVPDAISFAGQITKIETVRPESMFADVVKGLYVYGAKVVRPDHLFTAYLTPAGLST